MRSILILVVSLALVAFNVAFGAQQPEKEAQAEQAVGAELPGPGIGLGVTLPLLTYISGPPAILNTITTATTLIQFFVQAPVTLDLATRFGLRFYLSALGLRTDLTSFQGSALIYLNRGPARFYLGGGLGVFPFESASIFPGPVAYGPGLLSSFHGLAGVRVGIDFFGIFAELVYEVMPQPILDAPTAGQGGLVISSFQLTVGGMINF